MRLRHHPKCQAAAPTKTCFVLSPVRHPELHLADTMALTDIMIEGHRCGTTDYCENPSPTTTHLQIRAPTPSMKCGIVLLGRVRGIWRCLREQTLMIAATTRLTGLRTRAESSLLFGQRAHDGKIHRGAAPQRSAPELQQASSYIAKAALLPAFLDTELGKSEIVLRLRRTERA